MGADMAAVHESPAVKVSCCDRGKKKKKKKKFKSKTFFFFFFFAWRYPYRLVGRKH